MCVLRVRNASRSRNSIFQTCWESIFVVLLNVFVVFVVLHWKLNDCPARILRKCCFSGCRYVVFCNELFAPREIISFQNDSPSRHLRKCDSAESYYVVFHRVFCAFVLPKTLLVRGIRLSVAALNLISFRICVQRIVFHATFSPETVRSRGIHITVASP